MRYRITSAYEILEIELGLSVRLLGSIFFLLLRLFWMAFILHVTTDKVLVPLMGLSSSATPYLCVLLGLVTVIYTSMGGLRAVVVTDVAQSIVLLGGAVLTIGLVSIHFGGVSAWWPTKWPDAWPALEWSYNSDPDVRTVMSSFISTLVWYVSTSGSDQMAIQRYLATKDAQAARRTLLYSLVASTLVGVLLSIVGIALLAYYQAAPQFAGSGESVSTIADKLFPQFIASQMPVGISGLVIAGLLAAAMSSLSSGLNSSCSVITVDFIDRFNPQANKEAEMSCRNDSMSASRKKCLPSSSSRENSNSDHMKKTKYVSYLVGIATILLSSLVGMAQGNLLDMTFKICNLLVAPLFGLFFMAMFVPWANAAGTLIGAAVGIVAVFALSFWEDMTGTPAISILWVMPLGLLVQIVAGAAASLLAQDHGTR